MDLEDFFPETLEQLDQDETPLAFSTHLVSAEDGREYMKSSVVATLSSNRSRKVTTRTLRVRGVALEDLRQKKLDIDIDFDPMENDDVLKAGDLVATLIRVDTQFCLGVIAVKGFKILGQIMDLKHDSASGCWQWTGKYLRIDTTSQEAYATQKHFMLEFSSVLVHLLGPTLSSLGETTTYNIAGYELVDVLDLGWQMLDPESEQVLANIELLPQVTNPCLPYRNSSGKVSVI
ncbi:hypothetical protein B0H14DRAFT_2418957 [Mycena olivaceomarginata]|nr:hypothetical protein B0H14DRAFT_2418957 [Mycena olivaceomarginata]